MITTQKAEQIILTAIARFNAQAVEHHGSWYVSPMVEFINESTNSVAFCRHYRATGKNLVVFNLAWMVCNEDKLIDIAIHEMTHAFINQVSVRCNTKYPAHGTMFRQYMTWFGGDDTRAAIPLNKPETVQKKSATRVKRTYEYKCFCNTHIISAVRHGMINKGKTYRCNSCKTRIHFSQEVAV